jgi:amino acid adenylation domain-containing protein
VITAPIQISERTETARDYNFLLRQEARSVALLPDMSLVTAPEQSPEQYPNSLRLPPSAFSHSADAAVTVPQMVAARATEAPQAVAVVSDEGVLTYGELDRSANRIANRLVELQVSRETIVAVCLNRSLDSIVCALAVLKAGGAYLPIDPRQPIERISFMLNDANPNVLITSAELLPPQATGGRTVIAPYDYKNNNEYSSEGPAIPIGNNQLAYVIYTSGSTGQPKGVEVTHANLMNLVRWHQREFEVTDRDRASHLASVGFDAAVWEVWPYLAAGASLYLPNEETRLSPALLRDWLVANQITISFLPTALAERLMILDWPAETALRFLLTGADTLHRYPAKNLPFALINNYGPTECTVVATSGRVLSNDNDGLPAIGRAISHATVHVLDENLQQLAPGETGEVYVGGAGVARGYLNRPELTAEKFIPDPFSPEPEARMYRTGDLARIRPDGEIAYVGRIDEQIKILGYRIEPTEIEVVIDRHSAVAASVVVAHGCDCSDKRLIAYLTLRNGSTPSATELRQSLRSSLPDYMVPAVFVKLDILPLTVNGKIDRALLPQPTVENTLPDEDFVAPSSPIEQRLAKIICELFKLKTVSVNDNFFLLGGHSLLGAQLIVKIRSALGIDLALRALFDAPTIAELSREIERLIIARVESMSEEEARALLT